MIESTISLATITLRSSEVLELCTQQLAYERMDSSFRFSDVMYATKIFTFPLKYF